MKTITCFTAICLLATTASVCGASEKIEAKHIVAGVQWAAIGIEFEPLPRVRVVIQSESPQAATALAKKIGEASELLSKNEKARAEVPAIDEIIPLLTPSVENDRVVLTLSVENGRLPKLIEAVLPK